jgi:hypothetical protein
MSKSFMIASDIARNEGLTRAAISQRLKRALTKVYTNTLKHKIASGPFEAFETLIGMFDLTNESDSMEFFNAFPFNIQEQIKEDATRIYGKQ